MKYLRGTQYNDTLVGSSGRDIILGLSGDDVLYGRRGRDILQDDRGQDTLYGGFGSDVFLFTSVSNSLPSSPDVIRDFKAGVDVLDLSALNLDGLHHIKFTNNKVLIDVDADGQIDMVIRTNMKIDPGDVIF